MGVATQAIGLHQGIDCRLGAGCQGKERVSGLNDVFYPVQWRAARRPGGGCHDRGYVQHLSNVKGLIERAIGL
jgi:hypothetical protein